jgi:hypothetical protein
MAFQTSILRDGEWVTETVNLQAALKASATTKSTTQAHPEPPTCGILSRTVVESPIVHWILPVRLRSESHNDIAFVGVSRANDILSIALLFAFVFDIHSRVSTCGTEHTSCLYVLVYSISSW